MDTLWDKVRIVPQPMEANLPAVNLLQKMRCLTFLILIIAPLLGGCNLIGAVAGKMPKPDIAAQYKGLAGQTVGVMVWVDRSTAIDWPMMQLDIANSVDSKLREAQKTVEELKAVQFPYEPRSFIKYLREHPGSADMPITELAPKLGVSRLIYVEITNFSSRVGGSESLFLGQMEAGVKVVEVENGVARLGYNETDINVQYPRKATKDGVLNANDRTMYIKTIDEMSTEIAVRFFKHADPDQ